MIIGCLETGKTLDQFLGLPLSKADTSCLSSRVFFFWSDIMPNTTKIWFCCPLGTLMCWSSLGLDSDLKESPLRNVEVAHLTQCRNQHPTLPNIAKALRKIEKRLLDLIFIDFSGSMLLSMVIKYGLLENPKIQNREFDDFPKALWIEGPEPERSGDDQKSWTKWRFLAWFQRNFWDY